MIQSLVRCNLLLLAMVASADTTQSSHDSIKQALIGKIAYNQHSWDQSYDALFELAQHTDLDDNTYLQLFTSAMQQGKQQELLHFSIARTKQQDSSPLLYQKGQIVLQLYLNQNIAQDDWSVLSKNDWMAFFARIPAQQRLSFLEKVYQPDMVQAASARAFMIEMLFVVGLSQEALDLALFKMENPNLDIVQTYYQSFPAGVSAVLLAALSAENAPVEVHYEILNRILELQAERPLNNKVSWRMSHCSWSAEQRLSLARTAIACGHSQMLFQIWDNSSFNDREKLILSMEQSCYDENWQQLAQLLDSYSSNNDDFYCYYKGQLLASQGEIQRAFWSFDRIKNPSLIEKVTAIKTHMIVKENPAQAMAWAKELIDSRQWGPRELAVLQAQLMYEMGYQQEAKSLLEQLVEQEMGYTPAIRLLTQYYLKADDGYEKAKSLAEKYHMQQGKIMQLMQHQALKKL